MFQEITPKVVQPPHTIPCIHMHKNVCGHTSDLSHTNLSVSLTTLVINQQSVSSVSDIRHHSACFTVNLHLPLIVLHIHS